MEHLLVQDTDAVISVPYLDNNSYDNGDFLTYPDRMGWDISTWRWSTEADGFDLNGKTVEEMAAFLQCWLFFGLLESLFDGPISKDKFIRVDTNGEMSITTSSLPSYLQEWKQSCDYLSGSQKEKADDVAYEYLSEASTINGMLTYLIFYDDSRSAPECLKATLFAQTLLAEALEGARKQIFDHPAPNVKPCIDTFLAERMLASGWCITTIEYMQDTLPLQAQAFAFSLGSVRTSQDHSECEGDGGSGCKMSRVNENFKTSHVEADCCCAFISSPIDEVVGMLREGMIPVITITRPNHDVECVELIVDGVKLGDPCFADFQYTCPYFAVTHVWADGLGNPDGNSLPRCQILRLERLIRNLQGTYVDNLSRMFGMTAHESGTVAFWLDTLCIPVQEEYQSLRDFSIQKMQEIYSAAGGVLVLDPDLQQLSSATRPVDVLSRVLTSGWRGRLWTYQEGMLAYLLHIPCTDYCFTFIEEDDVLQLDIIKPGMIERQLVETLWSIFGLLVCNSTTKKDVTADPRRATLEMLKAISHRRTTRQGDETICIATFLGIDPSVLIKSSPGDRMPTLLSLMPAIPPEILFAHGQRLTQKGYRWAPKTFLSPFGLRRYKDYSLPLRYSPDSSNPRKRELVPRPFIHPNILGLAVYFPGLLIHSFDRPVPEVFSVVTPHHGTFVVEANDTGTHIPWPSIAVSMMKGSAILLSNLDFGASCLFVEVLGETAGGETIVEWKSIVSVYQKGECKEDAGVEKAEEYRLEGEYNTFKWWVVD